jgi:acyl transferase domain-containing protein/acyl carrier protein
LEIAVIGISAGFPGSANYRQYWEHLKEGREMITTFSNEELRTRGVSEDDIQNPLYVRSEGILENKDRFDSAFFGYRSEEAALMDPQIRLFHEHCWAALEDAGYGAAADKLKIGLFAGASANDNWKAYVYGKSSESSIDPFYLNFIMSHNFISSLVAYKLNFRGPSFFVDTACSTSLVAVHLACRSLLTKECKMALAGGVSLKSMIKRGYIYQEGMVSSKDGKVRTFDKNASGAVGGEGVGVVVLKRLSEAIRDRDHIYAIIRSTSLNNDGNYKVGYTAPGVKGQVECISSAQKLAGIDPASISYIETHGTATKLGDTIEIQALNEAFGKAGNHKFCSIGSVKTNIGHLDVAAGSAGLIKTILSLKNRQIPPSLHFKEPNPEIDFTNGPLYVNTTLKEWKSETDLLRAGVSAFGVGGANAHVILEEAPEPELSSSSGKYELLLLSARTADSLQRMTCNLAEFLKHNKDLNLADVCYTLQVGRKEFSFRQKILCRDIDEAIDALYDPEKGNAGTNKLNGDHPPVIFMFSGLGAQYAGMCKGLYEQEPVFRKELDECIKLVDSITGSDIKNVLYPENAAPDDLALFHQIDIGQYITFITEYALTKLLLNWGITPSAMIGYSFGEYVAACISGVFNPEDALKIIWKRATLIKKTPPGMMLSVPLTREELGPLLNKDLSLGIDNGDSCVVSGPVHAVMSLEEKLVTQKLMCIRLDAHHAAHSCLMDEISTGLSDYINTIPLHAPEIPFISNVTGDWIKVQEATSPEYWAKHLRGTVEFSKGIEKLLVNNKSVYIEIGPGNDISTLMNRMLETRGIEKKAINLVRAINSKIPDSKYFINKLGQLWLHGVMINWNVYHQGENRHRVSLPSYAFEPVKYDAEVNPFRNVSLNGMLRSGKPELKDWLYMPTWKRGMPAGKSPGLKRLMPVVLIFTDKHGLAGQMVEHINAANSRIILVHEANTYHKTHDLLYHINPGSYSDFEQLLGDLSQRNAIPDQIIHLFSITNNKEYQLSHDSIYDSLNIGYYSLVNLAQAIAALNIENKIQLHVVSNGLLEVSGTEEIYPDKTTVLGAVKVIPQELFNIQCRCIDIIFPENGQIRSMIVHQLLNEIAKNNCNNEILALRGDYSWLPHFENKSLTGINSHNLRLKEQGVYLLSGGLGGIALHIAAFLAKEVKARLVLIGRTPFPEKKEWNTWLAGHAEDDSISEKIIRLQEIERCGGKVLILNADVSDEVRIQACIAAVMEEFGEINGLIHTATLPDGSLLAVREKQMSEAIFQSKLHGTLILDRLLANTPLDFVIYFSALAALVGGFGQVAYCAANIFLDAFARYKSKKCNTWVVSINWSRWRGTGISRIAEKKHLELTREELKGGIEAHDAIACFKKILGYDSISQIAVVEYDLPTAVEQSQQSQETEMNLHAMNHSKTAAFPEKKLPRTDLSSEYVSPENETELYLAQIWENYFGLEKVGIDDNFFELGGDSLKGIMLSKKINESFKITLPLKEILMNATIRMIAARIDEILWINKKSERKYKSII